MKQRRFEASPLIGLIALALSMLITDGVQGQRAGRWIGCDVFEGYASLPNCSKPSSTDQVRQPRSDYGTGAFPPLMEGGPRPDIAPLTPRRIAFANDEIPGTIIIDTKGMRLYYTLGTSEAFVYPISVGRIGFTWTGVENVSRIANWPDWYPPKEMRERDPRLPEKMLGGIKNPLGAVALFLGNSLYRIHGTNDPKTIGRAASSGCFRMLNGHAVHLASLAQIGTVVKVVPTL